MDVLGSLSCVLCSGGEVLGWGMAPPTVGGSSHLNLIKIISNRYAQRAISRVILGLSKLTAETNHHTTYPQTSPHVERGPQANSPVRERAILDSDLSAPIWPHMTGSRTKLLNWKFACKSKARSSQLLVNPCLLECV